MNNEYRISPIENWCLAKTPYSDNKYGELKTSCICCRLYWYIFIDFRGSILPLFSNKLFLEPSEGGGSTVFRKLSNNVPVCTSAYRWAPQSLLHHCQYFRDGNNERYSVVLCRFYERAVNTVYAASYFCLSFHSVSPYLILALRCDKTVTVLSLLTLLSPKF